ncbi:MAG: carboxylate-amine ligase [Chitinophagales bacterium]|nr:carboxylate-amine ligase [Chitinophagales bacterium]
MQSLNSETDPQSIHDATETFPEPGSSAEQQRFRELQQKLLWQYEKVFPDMEAKKTIVCIPSLTIDQELQTRVSGSLHYEERLLSLLMLLRMPRTHVVYVTSMPIDEVIIDYYLHLLPGITGHHARRRLTMLSCFDASPKSLTEKILERPRLMERIREAVPVHELAHITDYNTTGFERTLAVRLNLPLFGCDPDLLHHGSKSGSRKIFRACGADLAPGYEDVKDEQEIIEALVSLKTDNPSLKKAVVKVNEGFSGEGNAIFAFNGCPETGSIKTWVRDHLKDHLTVVAADFTYEIFMSKFKEMQGIVEEFIPGEIKTSPSAQCLIDPMGRAEVISTHDQVLGGEGGQVFIGAKFPADEEYAGEIGKRGLCISQEMAKYGVMGRFSIDFISVKESDGWKHYAVEINLRKGGTTHPNLLLQGLTAGKYDAEKGIYLTASGQRRYYFSSDNVKSENYKMLTPPDLIDMAILKNLQYDGSTQQGVMFHLIGALSQYGKLGVVCIGDSQSQADALYTKTLQVLDQETEK